jgi:hypothetical protein
MHNNMKVMSDAVDWVTANQSRATVTTQSRKLPVSSNIHSSIVTTTEAGDTNPVIVRISDHNVQFQDADTSTP